VTFEEWRKEHLSMDGYPQYTAEDAWQASRRAALEEAAKTCDQMVSVSAIGYETGSACAAAIRALSQHKKGEP
jgi:hypothetical protein